MLEEAQAVEHVIPLTSCAQRRDYRALPIVTIDGETARDFDDAVRRRPARQRQLRTAGAHRRRRAVRHRRLAPIDQEARLRGTSVYFPDRAVPMLPLELSTDICSLRPHLDRLVMSCVMEIDHRARSWATRSIEGVIRSAERMTYTDVNAVLEGDEAHAQTLRASGPAIRAHARPGA